MPANAARIVCSVLLLLALQQLGGAALIHAKASGAPLLIAGAWDTSRARGGIAVKPWPWADTWPVARLRFPALDIDQYVLAGDSGSALAFGPGHAIASAPLGTPGQAVIGGHRDTHFAFLQHVHAGERFELQLPDGQSLNYRVSRTSVIDSTRSSLQPLADSNELLLVTCYPFGALDAGGPLRYVVSARPEPPRHIPGTGLPVLSARFSL